MRILLRQTLDHMLEWLRDLTTLKRLINGIQVRSLNENSEFMPHPYRAGSANEGVFRVHIEKAC